MRHSHSHQETRRGRYLPLSLLLAASVLATGAQSAGQPPSAADTRAADSITAAQLRDYLTFVASDELEGRNTPSRGLDTAAKFIAMMLARWGARPAGDNGTFFQKMALRKSGLDPAATTAVIAGRTLRYGTDFLAGAGTAFGSPAAGAAEGPVVFAGHGWTVKAKGIDPYAGLDVRDKIVALFPTGFGLPKGVVQEDLQGKQGEDWDNATGYAQRHGAKGILWLPTYSTMAGWERALQSAGRQSTSVVKFAPTAPAVPAITLSASAMDELFRGEKQSGMPLFAKLTAGDTAESFALTPTRSVRFSVGLKSEEATTQNVVAVVEGRDEKLKGEYVAFGAHYDHVGVAESGMGDVIFNGADDDGSGTVALLSIAEAFLRGPRPKRSLLFVWHAGEEKGLWGSRYFTESPTVPLDRIVAQLNIDMIGRSKKEGDPNPANRNLSGPNQIYVIGSRMMSTELGELSDRVNASYLKLAFDFRYDDPKDPNRFFFRSDHINYARKGIPIIFYFDGVHEDYHRPSDSPDRIDYEKLEKVTRTICATGAALAEVPARPKVDKQLPPEGQQGRRRTQD